MTRKLGDEWVELGSAPWWMSVLGMGSGPLLLAFYPPLLVLQLTLIFDVPLIWAAVLAIATCAGCVALGVSLMRLVYPPASLNPATSTLRAGRRQARYSEITSAQLLVSTSKTRRSVTLVLRSDRKLRGSVLVRDAQQHTLDPRVTALVQDLVRQSNITMPVSPNDPKGKFARYNFPRNITKEEALELLAHPPSLADRLPVPPAA